MLEAIAIKLVTTLAGYLFEMALESRENINIEGAPGWYGKADNKDTLYVYAFLEGGLETVDPIKEEVRRKMRERIQQAIDVTVYEKFRDVSDPKEKALVDQFQKDPNLALFVSRHLKFHKLEHFEAKDANLFSGARTARTFAAGVIPTQLVIDYQEERIKKIRYQITHGRADDAFEELKGGPVANDPFEELKQATREKTEE
jgi:hypothetical protein